MHSIQYCIFISNTNVTITDNTICGNISNIICITTQYNYRIIQYRFRVKLTTTNQIRHPSQGILQDLVEYKRKYLHLQLVSNVRLHKYWTNGTQQQAAPLHEDALVLASSRCIWSKYVVDCKQR